MVAGATSTEIHSVSLQVAEQGLCVCVCVCVVHVVHAHVLLCGCQFCSIWEQHKRLQ